MDAFHHLLNGFVVILTPQNLYYCVLGSLVGTLVGVLPGIGPLAAIFYGAMYGGSTTSILVNIPGEAASVVTCLDGHQMAKQGRAGAALGMAAFGSFIAGTLSNVGLNVFSPILVVAALKFGPPEYFALMTLGFVVTMFMVGGSMLKAGLMIALGLIVSTVGMDVVNGVERFTFGFV